MTTNAPHNGNTPTPTPTRKLGPDQTEIRKRVGGGFLIGLVVGCAFASISLGWVFWFAQLVIGGR